MRMMWHGWKRGRRKRRRGQRWEHAGQGSTLEQVGAAEEARSAHLNKVSARWGQREGGLRKASLCGSRLLQSFL